MASLNLCPDHTLKVSEACSLKLAFLQENWHVCQGSRSVSAHIAHILLWRVQFSLWIWTFVDFVSLTTGAMDYIIAILFLHLFLFFSWHTKASTSIYHCSLTELLFLHDPAHQGGVGFHSGQTAGKRRALFPSCLNTACPAPTLPIMVCQQYVTRHYTKINKYPGLRTLSVLTPQTLVRVPTVVALVEKRLHIHKSVLRESAVLFVGWYLPRPNLRLSLSFTRT